MKTPDQYRFENEELRKQNSLGNLKAIFLGLFVIVLLLLAFIYDLINKI